MKWCRECERAFWDLIWAAVVQTVQIFNLIYFLKTDFSGILFPGMRKKTYRTAVGEKNLWTTFIDIHL